MTEYMLAAGISTKKTSLSVSIIILFIVEMTHQIYSQQNKEYDKFKFKFK